MALLLLRVLVLGCLAAAADDESVAWWSGARTSLNCVVPNFEKVQLRRPPPPIDAGDHHTRTKTFTWTHNGNQVISKKISPNGTLEVPKRKDSSADGIYQCAVRNYSGGVVLGYPIHLKHIYIDKHFSRHPENKTGYLGQPVVIACEISSAPDPQVTWLKDGQRLQENYRYILLRNELLIYDLKYEDAGLYKCIAKNLLLNKTRVSHEGRLVVEEITEDIEPSALSFHLDTNVIVIRGSRVVLPCPVLGYPRPEMLWEQTPPGDRTAELDETRDFLEFPSVEFDQEGMYTCKFASTRNILRTFNVTVIDPKYDSSKVKIIIPPELPAKKIVQASNLRFNCTAVGKPEPQITWYKDGKKLEYTGKVKLLKDKLQSDKIELVIGSVTLDDAGVYQCFASNGVSTDSAWVAVNVTGGDVKGPTQVSCQPLSPRAVKLTWSHPEPDTVLGYTLHITQKSKSTNLGEPKFSTEQTVVLDETLQPYEIQIRAYINESRKASRMSEKVVCQGQGVPIKVEKLNNDSVHVSWKKFADENPDVKQWILQYKTEENNSEVRNKTLRYEVNDYTLNVGQSVLVRVLGTKTEQWLAQNLSLVPWSSSKDGGSDTTQLKAPSNLRVDVTSNSAHVTWSFKDQGISRNKVYFMVCLNDYQKIEEDCNNTDTTEVDIKDLKPNTRYEVQVQVKLKEDLTPGPMSSRYGFKTKKINGADSIKNVGYKVLNATSVEVEWIGQGAFSVIYSNELHVPIENWEEAQVSSNRAVITCLDMSQTTHVIVKSMEFPDESAVITIPPQYQSNEESRLHNMDYKYIQDGVALSWNGVTDTQYLIKYSQNLVEPIEKWHEVIVTKPAARLTGLDVYLPTYVYLTSSVRGRETIQQLTIEPLKEKPSSLYLGVGIGGGVFLLILFAIVALCLWRRRKRIRSPLRRPRNISSTEINEEEGSEMTNVRRRLANGGPTRGAGEPLLNGHVSLTENINISNKPNGKTRKEDKYEKAFDLSRYDDPNSTTETVLSQSNETHYNVLDTSRTDDLDEDITPQISAHTNFVKLPDDNMNSEKYFTQKNNSKIQPTLQPNG